MEQKRRKIRGWREKRFYVDNELLERYARVLKPHGIAIYNVLAKHANSQSQACFPSYETIMAQSGVGKRNTVSKFIKLLEALNLITIKSSKGKNPNLYVLHDIEVWEEPNSISMDTVRRQEKNTANSISKGGQRYPFRKSNSSGKVQNSSSGDTRSHTTKSDNNKSYKVNHCADAQRKNVQEHLDKIRKDLERKGIIRPKKLSTQKENDV